LPSRTTPISLLATRVYGGNSYCDCHARDRGEGNLESGARLYAIRYARPSIAASQRASRLFARAVRFICSGSSRLAAARRRVLHGPLQRLPAEQQPLGALVPRNHVGHALWAVVGQAAALPEAAVCGPRVRVRGQSARHRHLLVHQPGRQQRDFGGGGPLPNVLSPSLLSARPSAATLCVQCSVHAPDGCYLRAAVLRARSLHTAAGTTWSSSACSAWFRIPHAKPASSPSGRTLRSRPSRASFAEFLW